LILLAILMFWGVVRAAPSYSNVGQNLTYVGMNESIELRAKWTPVESPWLAEYAVSTGVQKSLGTPAAIEFNNDGSKMYHLDQAYLYVREYSLSTPYDVSTASYVDYLDVSADFSEELRDIHFNDDGSMLYVSGAPGGSGKICQYTLSTPYNISTGVQSGCISTDDRPWGITFNSNGTRLYYLGGSSAYIYSLSDPYNISTATLLGTTSSIGGGYDMEFVSSGDMVVKLAGNKFYRYTLPSPYDIENASLAGTSSTLAGDDNWGFAFNGNGTRVWVVDIWDEYAREYELKILLDTAVLYLNLTGSYQAVDTIDLNDSRTAKWSNFSYTPTTCNKVVGWKITANDSSATSNTTTIGTFYVMPYIYSGAGLNATCTSKHNATITPSTTGDINATFLAPYFVRNATFKECNYEITEDADRVKITNASEYCNITVINLEAESGTSFYLQESTGLSAYPPPNLPSAIAAAGLIIIVIYTITTRRR